MSLFKGIGEGTPVQGVTRLPVRQAGMSLPNSTKTAPENWTSSCVIIGRLITAIRGKEEFRTAGHAAYLRDGREDVRKRDVMRSEETLEETLSGAHVQVACRLRRATKMGSWLMVQTSSLNRTELGVQEWQYSSISMPSTERRILVKAHHNELRDGVADLSGKAFNPMPACDNPLIFVGYAVQRTKAHQAGSRLPTSKNNP